MTVPTPREKATTKSWPTAINAILVLACDAEGGWAVADACPRIVVAGTDHP